MLLARGDEAPAPESMGPPPKPEQPHEVVLQESTKWQAAQAAAAAGGESPKAPTPKWEAKPPTQQHSGPIRPLRPEAAQEHPYGKGAAPYRGGDPSPRQTPEGQASQLSGWSGTAGWGGSSANSAWGN
eukprot:4759817-Amphidinium_carterae.1